jgi:hypothetical protein
VTHRAAIGKPSRRYLVLPAGSYPAPKPPLFAAPAPSPEFYATPEPDLPADAIDSPDFGFRDREPAFPPFEEMGPGPAPAGFAAAQDQDKAFVPELPPAPSAAPRRVRALWARGVSQRMLLGAALGGLGGAVIGLVMLWMSQSNPPLMALADPVLLWRGVDQYHKFTTVLVFVGSAILGAAAATSFGGEPDAHRG